MVKPFAKATRSSPCNIFSKLNLNFPFLLVNPSGKIYIQNGRPYQFRYSVSSSNPVKALDGAKLGTDGRPTNISQLSDRVGLTFDELGSDQTWPQDEHERDEYERDGSSGALVLYSLSHF